MRCTAVLHQTAVSLAVLAAGAGDPKASCSSAILPSMHLLRKSNALNSSFSQVCKMYKELDSSAELCCAVSEAKCAHCAFVQLQVPSCNLECSDRCWDQAGDVSASVKVLEISEDVDAMRFCFQDVKYVVVCSKVGICVRKRIVAARKRFSMPSC